MATDGTSARAEVDRCPGCNGLFLEFFDGEPSTLARNAPEAPSRTAPHDDPERFTCPDCEQPMVARRYLGHGPSIPRCDSCLAVFLPEALLAPMAELTLEPEARESGWLSRLLDWWPR